MKWRSLVRISPPLLCGHVKKKKKKENWKKYLFIIQTQILFRSRVRTCINLQPNIESATQNLQKALKRSYSPRDAHPLCNAQLPLSHSPMANLNLKTDSPISRRIVRAFLEFLDSGPLSRSFSVSASIYLILCLDCEFLVYRFCL
jgi:hypothetical protein